MVPHLIRTKIELLLQVVVAIIAAMTMTMTMTMTARVLVGTEDQSTAS